MDRFLRQGDAVSGQIEGANCRRTCMQSGSSLLIGLTGNILMLFQMIVAVALALQGKVILGAMVEHHRRRNQARYQDDPMQGEQGDNIAYDPRSQ